MNEKVDTIKIGRTAIDVIAVDGSTCGGCVFRRCSHCPEEINSEWDCMNYRPGRFGITVKFTNKNADPDKLNRFFTYKLKKK
jgi:hypothetical protein